MIQGVILGGVAALAQVAGGPATDEPVAAAPRARAAFVETRSLAIDGDPSEWRGDAPPQVALERADQLVPLSSRPPADLWSGPADLSLRLWVGWNLADLVLGGELRDDVTDPDATRWYLGDSLELFLDVDRRDETWGPGDFQLMLSPDSPERPWGVYDHGAQAQSSGAASDGGFGGIEVACAPFAGGYRFEARIPWRNFARYEPRPGDVLGFNFAVCDRDGRGLLESYATWTGERDIARYAERRADLELEPSPLATAPAGASVETGEGGTGRSFLALGLAASCALALSTRRIWRRPRVRRAGLTAAVGTIAVAAIAAWAARTALDRERARERAGVERYWTSFESFLRASALGERDPPELVAALQRLLSGQAIEPVPAHRWLALAPAGVERGPELRTARRGIPYAPLIDPGRTGERGLPLPPGAARAFELDAPRAADGVHIVARVSDRRYVRTTSEVPLLSIELVRSGEVLPASRVVRHRLDLHYEEDGHVDRPGLEPAYYAPGGALGRVHGDGILLPLDEARDVDTVVVRHVGPPTSYEVTLVALSLREVDAAGAPPSGVRVTPDGAWQWAGHRPGIEAEITSLGRAPKLEGEGVLVRSVAVADEPIGTAYVRPRSDLPRTSRWDFLPLAALGAIAPFLVTLFAEWLGARRRIRGKLAVGFAVSSAVPLLALTLLLEASLRAEHERGETERAQAELARARVEIERELRELEDEARGLLRIAELGRRVHGRFPDTPEDLARWWGDSGGSVRLLERTGAEGRRTRVGTGAGWRQIPRGFALDSGLVRPWGQLFACGVAQTATGSDQPLTVAVLRAPALAAATAAGEAHPSPRGAASGWVRFIGAGRDPKPELADLRPAHARELRRGVFGPASGELVGVLAVEMRERGEPLVGDFTLTELLLAAAITAMFTALLFAGILTGHIVGPIERLDRAVRRGAPGEVVPDVADEIGNLTSAIQSFSSEVEARVRQLETLQLAQEDLSRRLDLGEAREAVLRLFVTHSGAASAWVLWAGENGEEPRAYGPGGRDFPLASGAEFLLGALRSGRVLHSQGPAGLPDLSELERALLGPVRSILCVPLAVAGDPRGAIVLGFAEDDRRVDLAFLRAAAAQAAIVLENARLYQQAVRDAVTGFLSDPGFRQRVIEEIQRAEGEEGAGVLLLQLRLTGLPKDDSAAAARMREAARRLRAAVRGIAVFGRAGTADLEVAIPWGQRRPSFEAVVRRVIEVVSGGPWPDGESVHGLLVARAAWPDDGPSARFVMNVLEERLAEAHTGVPAAQLVQLTSLVPPDFVAKSPLMLQLLDTLRRVSEQDLTVLITGETGVGKDRLAELVHRWSRRSAGPLVHVHCPSLTEALIEDELFGHEKGAFTGAHSRRKGPFEFAAGGTVVLDEIGGLAPAGQVALLRVLESREVLPLGAAQPVALDVRIVATSSCDLAAEVDRGRFRRELYFRLNVAQVTIPPLRLRKPAIPALVDAFVRQFNASALRPVTGVDPAVLDLFHEHDWPGNVRELQNVVSRAAVLASGGEIRPEHVDLARRSMEGSDTPSGGAEASTVISPRQGRLLERLQPGEWVTSAEYATATGTSARTALRDLLDLVGAGYLEREGSRRSTRFRRSRKRFPTMAEP